MDLREADESVVRDYGEHRERVFRSATLPLFGLPPDSPAERSLGGWQGIDDCIISLSLIHRGPLRSGHVEVITDDLDAFSYGASRDDPTLDIYNDWKGTVLDLVFSRQGERVMSGDRLRVDQAGKAQALTEVLGPMGPLEAIVDVDGEPVRFVGVAFEGTWAARAVVGTFGITVYGEGCPPDLTHLVRVSDLEPYIRGSSL